MDKVDEPVVIYPPNKPMERLLIPSKMPVTYDYMNFIDVDETGKILIGCSNLTGAYWEGTLFCYSNSDNASNYNYSRYYINDATVSDGKFIKNTDHIIVSDDHCNIKLLTVVDEVQKMKCEDIIGADVRIEQLALWNDSRAISCGDTTIAVWDIQNKNITHAFEEYKIYHTNLIMSVDVNKNDIHVFASASLDRKACIWDDRMEMPATVLYRNEFCGLSSVSWNPLKQDHLIVGSKSGDIYGFDIRVPNEFLNSYRCFDAAVYRTAFNNSGALAVCGDTTKVIVVEIEDNIDKIYESNDHTEYARGLSWCNNTLYSCGFDKKILKHIL